MDKQALLIDWIKRVYGSSNNLTSANLNHLATVSGYPVGDFIKAIKVEDDAIWNPPPRPRWV